MRSILAPIFLSAAVCSAAPPAAHTSMPVGEARYSPPSGTTIESSGFATIPTAPSLSYPDEPPPSDRGESEPERIARETGISVSEAEARMNPDEATMVAAMALRERLRREAAGSFIDVRIVRDPRPRYVFQFRRDGAATLRRFTSDPRFAAAEGGVPAEELEPLMHEWLRRLGRERLASAASIDPFEGVVTLHLGVGRSEYEPIAAREGWRLPERVRLTYAPELDPAGAVAADAAPFVRTFARANRAPEIILTVANHGRIVLRDGCFFVEQPNRPPRLALFGRNTGLHRDAEGYLAVSSISRPRETARIGETMIWGGYPDPVPDEPGVRALREHCGDAEIASVGEPTSAHAFRVRPWAIDNYAAARRITRRQAWDEIKACWARQDSEALRTGRPPGRDCDIAQPR